MNFPRLRRKCLEALQAHPARWRSAGREYEAQKCAEFCVALSSSGVRSFLLPANGEIIDSKTPTKVAVRDLKIPFSSAFVEFEFSADWFKNPKDYQPTACVLYLQQDEQGSIFICPAWLIGAHWIMNCHVVKLSAASSVTVRESGVVSCTDVSLYGASIGHKSACVSNLLLDYIDEIRVAVHFAMLASCDNVQPQKFFSPSARLVTRAKQRGNLPPDEYWVLDVLLDQALPRSQASGGTHFSPRFHMRRGHIRRISETRTTWVRPCAVGNPELGRVTKDYRVTGASRLN